MTTEQDLKDWFKDGKQNKAKYMLIVCDTFSHEDFHVLCMSKHEMETKRAYYTSQPMSRIMEIYDLSKAFNKQPTTAGRAWAD